MQPTATPDLDLAALRIDDMPAGFEAFQPADIGLTSTLLRDAGLDPWMTFGFRHPVNYQFAVGVASWFPSPASRWAFDSRVGHPEPLAKALLTGAGATEVQGLHPLTGYQDVADTAGAMTADFVYAGVWFRADLVLFRQGSVGALLLVGRPAWETSWMDAPALAALFHARVTSLIE